MVRLLSGGAAKGVVLALADEFRARSGADIDGEFTAVGALRDRVVAGEAADVLILTQALIEDLTARGLLVAGSARPLGGVRTGVAIPAGHDAPDISDNDSFARALTGATAIYIPDPVLSTAGVFFMRVVGELGVRDAIEPKLRAFPNGETAMRTMAERREKGSIGCTQMTEILMTDGLVLLGPLPPDHDSSTIYMAAVTTGARNPAEAHALMQLVSASETAQLRRSKGYEV
ncbi:MAG: substrate-binding domain-containing protein [Beijerinckiaceae bacterium]|nr:substrate-binding domain-containing protein [Beijerinckiaceae bacterium]